MMCSKEREGNWLLNSLLNTYHCVLAWSWNLMNFLSIPQRNDCDTIMSCLNLTKGCPPPFHLCCCVRRHPEDGGIRFFFNLFRAADIDRWWSVSVKTGQGRSDSGSCWSRRYLFAPLLRCLPSVVPLDQSEHLFFSIFMPSKAFIQNSSNSWSRMWKSSHCSQEAY